MAALPVPKRLVQAVPRHRICLTGTSQASGCYFTLTPVSRDPRSAVPRPAPAPTHTLFCDTEVVAGPSATFLYSSPRRDQLDFVLPLAPWPCATPSRARVSRG